MKKTLVLAMSMALGVTASAYAANPFADVPAGHWAYDSVKELAEAGIVEGYDDGSFGGERLMTRYEMAQIVAKAMANGTNVDRLAAEFADELDNLGVRVTNLEKKTDNVKITGEIRYNYTDSTDDFNGYASKLRSRIWLKGQVNDDWSYTGMLQNEQNLKNNDGDEETHFQRAYVNGKVGGVQVQAGRYNLKLVNGNVYDERFDGIQGTYGKDIKLTVGYGKATPSTLTTPNDEDSYVVNTHKLQGKLTKLNDSDSVWYGNVSGKIGKLSMNAGYYKFKNVGYEIESDAITGTMHKLDDFCGTDDLSIYNVSAKYAFDHNVNVGLTYLKGDDTFATKCLTIMPTFAELDDDGYIATTAYKGAIASDIGSWGVVANYYNQGTNTYLNHTMNGAADKMFGFKGYSVAANYTLAKNIVGQVEYYDLEEKEGNKREAKTLWTQVVFTF